MTEAQIQTKILAFLKGKAYSVKTITTNKAGVPDILVCYKGLFLGLEVKRPKNPSKTHEALQAYHQQAIRDNGGISQIVTSVDDVKKLLNSIDQEFEDIKIGKYTYQNKFDYLFFKEFRESLPTPNKNS